MGIHVVFRASAKHIADAEKKRLEKADRFGYKFKVKKITNRINPWVIYKYNK